MHGLALKVRAFSHVVFIVRIEILGDRATKNFWRQIRARDQKHNLGIGVSGWILEERRRRRCTGSFRNYMLVEQKNEGHIEHFRLRNQTRFIH